MYRHNKLTVTLGIVTQLLVPFVLWYIVYISIEMGYLWVTNATIGCAGGVFLLYVWDTKSLPLWSLLLAYLAAGYLVGNHQLLPLY